MIKDKDKIIHYKKKFKITNYTTYEDLRRAIYCCIIHYRQVIVP